MAGLKHAFAIHEPGASLSPEDEALLDKVAKWSAAQGLAPAMILFLETYRPMGYMGSQVMTLIEPFVSLTTELFPGMSRHFSEPEFKRLISLLEQRSTITDLIQRITRYGDR